MKKLTGPAAICVLIHFGAALVAMASSGRYVCRSEDGNTSSTVAILSRVQLPSLPQGQEATQPSVTFDVHHGGLDGFRLLTSNFVEEVGVEGKTYRRHAIDDVTGASRGVLVSIESSLYDGKESGRIRIEKQHHQGGRGLIAFCERR